MHSPVPHPQNGQGENHIHVNIYMTVEEQSPQIGWAQPQDVRPMSPESDCECMCVCVCVCVLMKRKKNHQFHAEAPAALDSRALVKGQLLWGPGKRKRGRSLKVHPGELCGPCKASGCQLGAPNQV